MASAFLDLTGLSHFLDKLKLLIVQSDWAKTDSSDMAFIQNKPTISVEGQTLVLTGWGNSAVTSFTVTFMLNDGTETVYDTQTVTSGGTASAPATNPTRTDYDFGGWYEDSAGTSAFNFSTPITADKTLYAKWTAQATGPVTITVTALDNQRISLYSTDSSFTFDSTTLTGTIAKGANLVVDAIADSGYNAGSLIINGTAQTGTHAGITADSDLTISAADATKILVNLGNYSGTMTVGSQGDPTTQYGGGVGYFPGQFGSMSPTSWGDCEVGTLGILYGQFWFEVDAGENSGYATNCLTGTLTVGTFSAQVSGGTFVDSANTEAFRTYLAQHIGETLNVAFNLSALDGYTKATVTVGSNTVWVFTLHGFNSGTGEGADYGTFGSITPSSVGSTVVEMAFSMPDLDGNWINFLLNPSTLSARYGDGSDLDLVGNTPNYANRALGAKVAAMSDGDTFDVYLKESA